MIGSAKCRPMNQNGTDCVQDQHHPAISELHSPRPPPEKPRTKQRKQWRYKRPCEIERVHRKWLQQKRQSKNEIVERRGRVWSCSLWKILKSMMPHDEPGLCIAHLHARHPRVTIRIDKINVTGDKNILIIRAARCQNQRTENYDFNDRNRDASGSLHAADNRKSLIGNRKIKMASH